MSAMRRIQTTASLVFAALIAVVTLAAGTGTAAAAVSTPYTMYPYPVNTDIASMLSAAQLGPVNNRVPGNFHSSPVAPPEAVAAANQGRALVGPGTPVLFNNSSICTISVAGHDADGRAIALSAGHCGGSGSTITSMDAYNVGVIGTVTHSDSILDFSIIELYGNTEVTTTYGVAHADWIGGALPAAGQNLCKLGIATGWTCGVLYPGQEPNVSTQVCAAPGDSGAPVFHGTRLVGVVKGANSVPACYSPLQGSLFAPTIVTSLHSTLAAVDAVGGPGRGFTLG